MSRWCDENNGVGVARLEWSGLRCRVNLARVGLWFWWMAALFMMAPAYGDKSRPAPPAPRKRATLPKAPPTPQKAAVLQSAQKPTGKALWEQAQVLFRAGRKLAVAKKYQAAIGQFQKAIGLLQRASGLASEPAKKKLYQGTALTMLYIIGRTHQLAKEPVKAYKVYRQCLAQHPSPRTKAIVERFLKQVRPQVEAKVTITSKPSGATVVLVDSDGKTHQGKTPYEGRHIPGTLKVSLRHTNYTPLQKTLQLAPGGAVSETMTFIEYRVVLPEALVNTGFWVSLSATLGLVVIGTPLMIAGIVQERAGLACSKDITRPECLGKSGDDINAQIDGGHALKVTGIVLLVVGGVAAGSSVVFWILRKNNVKPPPPRPAATAPQGAILLGSF